MKIANISTSQSGQTLIETLVGLSVLVTGIVAGLSLAIFSFSGISDASQSDVASGFAREGIEAVRRLRDSNWLAGTISDCSGIPCYPLWLSAPYDITGAAGTGKEYRVIFNPSASSNKWTISLANSGTDFRLYVQSAGAYTHTVSANPTPFSRKINIIYASTASPYDATSPLVLARSTVWWTGRRCPAVSDPSLTTCKIVSEIYLTNWKNY